MQKWLKRGRNSKLINKLYQSDVETIQYFLRDMIDLERAVEAARRAVEDANKDAELACEIAEATSDDDPVELLENGLDAPEASRTKGGQLSVSGRAGVVVTVGKGLAHGDLLVGRFGLGGALVSRAPGLRGIPGIRGIRDIT